MNVVPDVPTIRRSLAEGLATCPAFVMERSERLAFGQAAHQFIAAYWRHLQALREESDLTGWLPLAQDAWARTPGLLQSRWQEYHDLCERFAASHLGELDTLHAVEEPVTHHVGWGLLVCTPDRIDRIDGGDRDDDPTWLLLRDYKTELGEMDHEFQVHWYAEMLFRTRPALERIDVELDLIRMGRPKDRWTIERGDLDAWWDTTLDALRHRLDIGPGFPVGGPACEGCALRRTCGETLTTAALVPEDEEAADALLAEHRRLEAAAGARWEALQAFYRDRLPRVVNGEEVGYLSARDPQPRAVAGPKDIVRWAFRHGMDGWDFVRPSVPSNRGLRDQMTTAGLLGPGRTTPTFKTRMALTGTRSRRREVPDD